MSLLACYFAFAHAEPICNYARIIQISCNCAEIMLHACLQKPSSLLIPTQQYMVLETGTAI